MQFNRVNKKEHKFSLIVRGFCICPCVSIPHALCLRHSCVCFEKKILIMGLPIDPMPNSPNKHDENYLADSKENW